MGLVLQNFAFGTLFDGEDPSAANGFPIRGNVLEGISAEIKKLLNFGVHGFFPLGPVGTGHDFLEGFRIIREVGDC